jgi:hypothetical protein
VLRGQRNGLVSIFDTVSINNLLLDEDIFLFVQEVSIISN